MSLSKEDIAELKDSQEYKDAFNEALKIHRQIHDYKATHFRECLECKSGFALLFIANLELLNPQCHSIAVNYGQRCQLRDGHSGDHKAGPTSWK